MRPVIALLMGVCSTALLAQEILISPESLAKQLGARQLVILHAGSKADYEAGHVPGAQLVTLMDLANNGALRLELPTEEDLRARLLKLGISDASEVVIYAGSDSVQTATRVWFTFDYLSLRAKLLDGGLAAWRAKGLPLSAEVPNPAPATQLSVKARPEIVVDAQWLKDHLQDSGLRLIDARLPEFYSGADPGQFARGGHIPGALNHPFPSWLAPDKTFLPKDVVATRLSGADTIVTYCHIGMQATVPYFAARLAGKQAKLYDGSFQDWSGRPELPVEPKTK